MVARVRLGRRRGRSDASPDDQPGGPRWAGPPPLLMIVTVVGLFAAPLVDHDAPDPAPQATTVVHELRAPRLVEARHGRQPADLHPPESRGGVATRGIKPLRLKPVPVGVASMNMFRKLSTGEAEHDARRLTGRDGVDVVGWQEADGFGRVLRGLPGWSTKTFPLGESTSELAVSWRSSEFALVSAHQRRVAWGVSWREGRYPFGNRFVAVVTLRHRESGQLLTVIDVHLPQAIEDFDRPGRWRDTINANRARVQLRRIVTMWKRVHSRWVVGTGDYNFDARADAREQTKGGPRRTLGATARSSYQVLGTDVAMTHPPTDRHIDYVWADRSAYDAGRMRFTRQRVPGGFDSDHRPLIARLILS